VREVEVGKGQVKYTHSYFM